MDGSHGRRREELLVASASLKDKKRLLKAIEVDGEGAIFSP